MIVALLMILLCTAEAPSILLAVTGFLPFHPLTTFVWVWVSFQTTNWFVNCPTTTTYLCWLCHSSLPEKENYFVWLFTVAFSSGTRWAPSPTIPHGMHLVVPTNPSLFWVLCHTNRTFPPKKFERKPQNRLSLLPTTRPFIHLPLTHDPPLLYWLGTGWWCSGLAHAPLQCISKAC